MDQHAKNAWTVAIVGGAIATVLGGLVLVLIDSARAWLFYKGQYSNLTIAALTAAPLAIGFLLAKVTSRPTACDETAVDTQAVPPVAKAQQPEIDDIDRHVIRGLISFDGEWEGIAEIAVRVGRPKLVVTRSLEKLVGLGLAKDNHAVGHDSLYKLSSEGTSYAIENELHSHSFADEAKTTHQTRLARIASDKKQLANLFKSFPYDQSVDAIFNADHSGVTKDFARSLDLLLNFRNAPYQLLDKGVESKRVLFLDAAAQFYEALLTFVSSDDKHQRLTPPYHLKGGASESAYRAMQRDVTMSAKALVEAYDALIAQAKSSDVFPD